MKISFLVNLCLVGTALSCGMDPISTQDNKIEDTYNTTQDHIESDSGVVQEIEEDQTDTGYDTSDTEDIFVITDFSEAGSYEVSVYSLSASVTECSSMNYSVYSPVGVENPRVAMVAHGFARGSGVMSGWAEHLASWGVEVLLPTLCHYNVFAGVDHEMNGQNMKELAAYHGASEVVYVGHSAGGLAALIAASQDNNAAGVLGLDTTDTQDIPGVPDYIGRDYAGEVTCQAFFIMGEPSSCNSNNNGLELFRMIGDYQGVKVVSSDHCDFENPTDAVCQLSCENSTVIFGDGEIRSTIQQLGTAAVLSLTGVSEHSGELWSSDGLEEWLSSGLVQELN